MKRRKPLKRSPMPPRKTWMKRQGPKKRKEKSDTDVPRELYRIEFPTCQLCRKRKSRDTHEIASGGARFKSVYQRATFLAVCRQCHREIHDEGKWPISLQLYWKQRDDPKSYDRRLVNRLRGRNEETAITQEEVDAWSQHR